MINRTKLIIFFIIGLLAFSIQIANTYEDYFSENEPLISMDLQDANLKDVLKIFSQQSGLNFIASEAIQNRRITLYLDKVSVDEALDKILTANNLTYQLDKKSNIFIVKELGKPGIETMTKVFYLKYARVSGSKINKENSDSTGSTQQTGGIKDAIEKMITANGKVVEDVRTNSLVVTDVPNIFPFIEQAISKLDIPTPQVLLEVEMLDVSKNTVDKLGMKFGQTPFKLSWTGPPSVATGFPFKSWSKASITESTTGALSINSSDSTQPSYNPYTVLLDFLKTQTDTKYLARPRILTLSNETAEIKITTSESVGVKTTTASTGGSSGSTTQEPERVDTGVSLRVTPQVNTDTGDITMFVEPQVSEARTGNTLTVGANSFTYRDPETRSTKSTVMLKDGQTIVIGGLIRNILSQTETKLPILGDIPFLGALFRHKDKSKDETRELIIFITPHIVKEPTFKEALSPLNTKELDREQFPSSRVVEMDKALDRIEDKRL